MFNPILYQYIDGSMSLEDVENMIPEYKVDPSSGELAIVGNANDPFIIPYNAVVDILINNTDGGEHPMHFHGHKFWVIATSEYPEAEHLYVDNYLLRDIVSVPAQGWAKIRFIANNPGVWLLHCQITWHIAAGLTSKVIEAPVELHQGLGSGTIKSIPSSQLEACPKVSATPFLGPTATPNTIHADFSFNK